MGPEHREQGLSQVSHVFAEAVKVTPEVVVTEEVVEADPAVLMRPIEFKVVVPALAQVPSEQVVSQVVPS